jgi:RimJ/RimL family protein N-acetyltransferase
LIGAPGEGYQGEMTRARITLRPATHGDIDTIMTIERRPGYEHLVRRSARSIHDALINDPGHAYLLGLDNGEIIGFAILRDIGSEQGGLYLKRIAVADPGRGDGSALLGAVIDWGFSLGSSHRFHLDHFADNHRAHRAYEKCGLRQEGILREAYRLPDGRFADLAVMAILRDEWVVLRNKERREAALATLTPLQLKLRNKGLAAIAQARRQLFRPLGEDCLPEASANRIVELWEAMKRLHSTATAAEETRRAVRGDGEALATALEALANDLPAKTPVDLVFSHLITSSNAAIDWHECFAGAFACDLQGAIALVETLDRHRSPLLRDDVVIAARDRGWALWIDPETIIRTAPKR